MAEVTVAIDLPHEQQKVWDEISDLERHGEWMSDAERIDFLSEQRRGVGTGMKVRTRVGPLVTTDVIVVDEWVEGERIGVTHRGLVSGQGAFELSATGDGTRFEWNEDLEFPWFLGGGLTALAARPILARIWRGNLARFAATLD